MANEDYPRSHRVADFIQREISQLIRTEVKDPRVSPMLTVASVEVSRDLSHAKIYYTLFDSEDRADTQTALTSAAPFLRRRLASLMRTRTVPDLKFYHDDSSEKGAAMSVLIDAAVASNTTDDEPGEDRPGDDVVSDDVAGGAAPSDAAPSDDGPESDQPDSDAR